jgi:hypothetical protein
MRALEVAGVPERRWVVVFEAGDHAVEGLQRLAVDAGIDGAQLTAIGGFREATVGWFDVDRHDYRRIDVREQVEVLSLVGDITRGTEPDGPPKVHMHAVLGTAEGRALGGHLLGAIVRPTLEVVITETSASLPRRHDQATGLALIDLDAAATVRAATLPAATHPKELS